LKFSPAGSKVYKHFVGESQNQDIARLSEIAMKKTISLIFSLLLLVALVPAELAAQTRINFRRGASSATVRGTIGVNRGVAGANYRRYVLRANGGQVISATVSSRNGRVYFAENDDTSYQIETNRRGDYVLTIYNGGANSTTYAITVSIR
jgi:hypothetical protein